MPDLNYIRGHGVILNMSSWAPFVFTYNPPEVESKKKINYAVAPNIGGAYKKKFFSGFDAKEISVQLVCNDFEDPLGVSEEIAYFEQLREPDPGPFGGWGLSYGNENYPPPQILYWFGVSFIPLVWDVTEVNIKETHFHAGRIRGVFGIPKRCEIDLSLSLDEGHILNRANQVAKKAEMYLASAESIIREYLYSDKGTRKEIPGLFSSTAGNLKGSSNVWPKEI
jgi:hypothetical protein